MDVIGAALLAQLRLELLAASRARRASQRDLHAVAAPPRCRARELGALRRILVENRIGVVDVDEDPARRPRAAARATRACRRRRSAADGRCRGRACATSQRDHLVVAPERAVDEHAGGRAASRSTRSLHRRPRPGAYTAERPLAASLDARARRCRRAPATARFGEYGAGLLATGKRAPATPATPSTVKSPPSQSHARAARRRSSAPARRASGCRGSGRRRRCRCTRSASGRVRFAQHEESRGVIDLAVDQHDGGDRGVAQRARPAAASGFACSCARMSGEALTSTQARRSLPQTAIEDWVRGRARTRALRTPAQLGQLQFHWGKPPPAADPSTRIFTEGVGAPALRAGAAPSRHISDWPRTS